MTPPKGSQTILLLAVVVIGLLVVVFFWPQKEKCFHYREITNIYTSDYACDDWRKNAKD